VTFVKRT